MPSYLVKSLFIILSFSPLLSLVAFFYINQVFGSTFALIAAITTFGVGELICYLLLNFCKKNYQVSTFKVDEIYISRDIINFFLATLLPFLSFVAIDFHGGLVLLLFLMLFSLIFLTDTLQYNIALSFLGYKAYQVKNESGLNYILFSKRRFDNKNQLNRVIRINRFMVLDYDLK